MVRLLSLSFLALLIFIFSGVAIRFAAADFYFERAKTAYSSTQLNELQRSEMFLPFLRDLESALTWRSSHVDAIDLKADIFYQIWWLFPDAQYYEESSLLQSSIKLHESGLLIRKNWSYSQARMALIFSHGRELGPEFDRWFKSTHKIALYEAGLARSMMTVGLANWPRLSRSQQQITVEFIVASIEQKSNSLSDLKAELTVHKKLGLVCENTGNTERSSQLCAPD